ncbi:chromosome partitioning protein ParB [Clostridium polyendosporum]|uniref:Chromosome partitioning protein ParB n=1 Tax=Clostridium polyendosporum TaxID=69208 RepID=A0A919VGM4_9CLOT|nr:DUF1015 family protein [Clostridium polyendosporum]GIM29327.1 chromosome partitioning protein ParB [Clostridium polyendosporum]
MATIRAFKAVRPTKELSHMVAALPYDVMNSEEAREMVKDNPYSFLHVDRAEVNLPHSVNIYDESVYKKAREILHNMIEKSVFIEDKKPCLYVYRQTMNGRSQTGLVACVSIDDYINNRVKKHEHTRPDKEQDRINHVNYCDANTGPIFLTYREEHNISEIIDEWTERQPVYNFVAEDGIGHTAWVIDDKNVVDRLTALFKKVQYLYIADGHHRAASAARVGLLRREEKPNYTGEEEFNFFLSVIFPDSHLRIMDYNRVVKDLNGLKLEKFLEKVEENFYIFPRSNNEPYRPEAKHTFGLYVEGKWYKLESKEGTFDEENPIERLDVSILQKNLLYPVLGIEDERTDKRIGFVGGIRGLKELEKRANNDMKVAFSLYPTTVEDIMDIADIGEVMPPKSTWFEPKLRSGLFIHKLT